MLHSHVAPLSSYLGLTSVFTYQMHSGAEIFTPLHFVFQALILWLPSLLAANPALLS